jgi:small redox-active disulfide protein 2
MTYRGLSRAWINTKIEEKSMEIKVCGPGCASCEQAQKVVEAAITATGVKATVSKVTDFAEIAGLGIFSTPAVVIEGEVKCVGRVPKQAEVEEWIS